MRMIFQSSFRFAWSLVPILRLHVIIWSIMIWIVAVFSGWTNSIFLNITTRIVDYTLCHIGVRAYTISFRSGLTLCAELGNVAHYWMHCSRFPHCITLKDDQFDELLGILIQLIASTSLVCHERNELIVILIGMTTSPQSLAPADGDELHQWYEMADRMKCMYRQI